jgi:hypothetical protein
LVLALSGGLVGWIVTCVAGLVMLANLPRFSGAPPVSFAELILGALAALVYGGPCGAVLGLVLWSVWFLVSRRAGALAARRLGLLLAVVAAAQAAYCAALAFAPGTASLSPIACFQAAVALGLTVLGGFLLRGSRAAIIGLMIVCTIQVVVLAAWASDASFLLLPLVGWAIFMRAFYLALCAERSRKGVTYEIPGPP